MVGANDSLPAPSFRLEAAMASRHGGGIAGIDEAGRGPWAGPVVAAAVILDPERIPAGLNDSKQLSEPVRERLFGEIANRAQMAVGIAEVGRIDRDNILQATLWAMAAALHALPSRPAAALVDGNRLPPLPCPAQAVIKGDALSLSIAAASIVAKVTRDRLMRQLARDFPGYGWERNKGYGTQEHRSAIADFGVTPQHRRSFAPIRDALLMAGEQ
jgi:ribonuclease HII